MDYTTHHCKQYAIFSTFCCFQKVLWDPIIYSSMRPASASQRREEGEGHDCQVAIFLADIDVGAV